MQRMYRKQILLLMQHLLILFMMRKTLLESIIKDFL
nr:MAG TPA: hypothetical protein [Bacteriophage sp.]